MEITVSGRHIEITPAIKTYATTKAAKLPRYFDRVQAIEVVICRHDSRSFEVDIIGDVEHADAFVAKSTGVDLYACVDEVIHKMERQLTDHKEKLRNRKHNI